MRWPTREIGYTKCFFCKTRRFVDFLYAKFILKFCKFWTFTCSGEDTSVLNEQEHIILKQIITQVHNITYLLCFIIEIISVYYEVSLHQHGFYYINQQALIYLSFPLMCHLNIWTWHSAERQMSFIQICQKRLTNSTVALYLAKCWLAICLINLLVSFNHISRDVINLFSFLT